MATGRADELKGNSVRSYNHRAGFGAWLNDMNNEQMPHENWPCKELTPATVAGITRALGLQSWGGFNEFNVFGLCVTRDWPLDIASAMDEDRKRRAKEVIDAAHENGIRVLLGLGVYSWGFDTIIANCPGVKGEGPDVSAMCGSKPESWQWMKKVIDFHFTEFELDGFHLEASDQGRCYCAECKKMSDVVYFNTLNARCADHIRSKWPDKTLMVNMCGYVRTNRDVTDEEFDDLVKLGDHIDYLIDAGHRKLYVAESARRDFLKRMKCDFGTSAGTWIYPPQRWDRLRWFIPYTNHTGSHIKELYEDGGRAIEYYMGPTINPGVEVNVMFGGRILSNVDQPFDEILRDVVEALYRPRSAATRDGLVDIFQRAESAWFDRTNPDPHCTKARRGEVHVCELFGTNPGPPGHLRAMTRENRAAYKEDLLAIKDQVLKMMDDIGTKIRAERIVKCVDNNLTEIELVDAGKA